MESHSPLFKFGIFLFGANFPLGIGGMAVAGIIYSKTDDKLWLWIGSGFYIFTWIMLGVSFLICGREGIKLYRNKKKEGRLKRKI